jgi:hypothetical protein
VGPSLRGAGPKPFARSSLRIVVARLGSRAWRAHPGSAGIPTLGFSLPIRRMSSRTSSVIGGLPPADLRPEGPFPSHELPVPPKECLGTHQEG